MKVMVKDVQAGARVLAGRSGLRRIIASPQVVTLDLSSGAESRDWASNIVYIRPSQLSHLRSLPRRERLRTIRSILSHRPACIVVNGGDVSKELLEKAESGNTPILKTGDLLKLTRMLAEKYSQQTSIHGVLVQIFGIGTLLIGNSAVGKSEVALDLILRGHKLVADDVVIVKKMGDKIEGRPTDLGADLLQIRGVGIIDIHSLYGESATLNASEISLVVELAEWQKGHQYALIGLRERRYRLLGVNIPYLKLPVKAGRNMAALIEVAVRNQMMKQQGIYTARSISKKLKKRLTE